MKKKLLRFVEKIASPYYGKKRSQSFFTALYHIGIRGMNLRNSDVHKNGEYFICAKVADYFSEKRKTGLVLFDIGANVGNYTRMLDEIFQKRKLSYTIHSFEPLPAAFSKIEAEFSENERVKLNNIGIGRENGMATLFSNAAESEIASLYKHDDPHMELSFDVKTDIHIRNLDQYCQDNSITTVNFMKIDTEGGEYDILSSSRIISSNVEFIQFEFGTSNIDSKTYFRNFFDVLSPHYKIYRILRDGLYPYDKYNPDMEIMVLGNYLAISKKISDFKD
jgi:FkbM family methyltransferase